jgi:hypothetical protein
MFATREEWLTAALAEVRPLFEAQGHPPAAAIRVTCGFPSNARRTGAVGECWADTASADKTMEILISPVLADPLSVFATLLHEVAHTTPGAMNHGASFAAAARSVGLMPVGAGKQPWKSTAGNDTFAADYAAMLDSLGPYPHAALTINEKPKQQTLMLKACCPSCGYTVRLTRKWADQGLPICPVDGSVFALEGSAA